jgi:hypothetical protein
MRKISSLRRRGMTASVIASSVAALLVGLLACPVMLPGLERAGTACAEHGDSHAPISDTRMSCCSEAELPQLARAVAYSPEFLKNWAVAVLHAGPPLTQPRLLAVRFSRAAPTETSGPPLFLQNGSFLI